MTVQLDSSQLAALLNWLESHSAQLPQLLSDLEAVFAAGNLVDFWTALKTAGDLVVPWLEDFPTDPASASAAQKLSVNFSALLNALPQLIALVQAIAAAFGGSGGNSPAPSLAAAAR